VYDFIVEIDTEDGNVLTENLVASDPDVVVDVDTSGNLVETWESDLSSVEVLVEGPQGAGYAILDAGEDPPPGTPEGTVFFVRQA